MMAMSSLAAFDLVLPTVLLLLLRWWTGRGWLALVGTAVAAPVVAFFLTGGVAWLLTYYRVVVNGDTSVPDSIGQPVPDYLARTFVVCGVYGVLFAGSGFLLQPLLAGLWQQIHPRSFDRLTRLPDRG